MADFTIKIDTDQIATIVWDCPEKAFNILNFELSIEEMSQISNINSENHRIVTREKMDDKDPPMGKCVPDWD